MLAADAPPPQATVPRLLDWISRNRRDLPWRRRRDPYAVWISEVMLQQTQVNTVIPYFERWLARFPDVPSLAAAPLADVLKAWEGLGYYARARNLQRASQEIVARHGGQLPSDRRALLALPGIGRYTAGAILSLAFDQREPVLDGNVRRVLCRVYDVAQDVREPAVQEKLWGIAADLVDEAPAGQAGDLNEALMELGALVCTPAGPECGACPLAGPCPPADLCVAHRLGNERQRPVTTARPKTPHYDVTAAVIKDEDGRCLLIRRAPDGLLGGLWGFPGSAAGDCGSIAGGDRGAGDIEALAGCLAKALRQGLGIEVIVGAPLPAFRHAYTHFRITLHAFVCTLAGGERLCPPGRGCRFGWPAVRWVSPAETEAYALAVTDRKVLKMLGTG